MAGIPDIDVSGLRGGGRDPAAAAALCRASREVGFMRVSGHGEAAHAAADRARALGLDFFRRPEAEKRRVAVGPGTRAHRGFIAGGGARMDDDVPPDRKETLIWGPPGDAPRDAASPLRAPDRWPGAPAGLAEAALEWSAAAQALALDLLRGFALGLGLPEGHFARGSEAPLTRGSMVFYPPDPSGGRDGAFGVGPHTDFGVLTVLFQDDVGGLEVQGQGGEWIPVPPEPGRPVVNVGDLLERWSAGLCRSTPHRVVNRSGRERLSLVLAYDPDGATPIDPAPAAALGGRAPEGPTRPCGEWLEKRFALAYAHLAAGGAACDGAFDGGAAGGA